VRGLAHVAFVFICPRSSLATCAGSASPDSPWEFSVGGQVGVPRGYVQVRENGIRGTRLQLHRDLGIDTSEALTVGGAYHLTAVDALRLTFDSIFLYGSSRPSTEVKFNGTTLRAGTDLDTEPEFFRLTALYERHLLDLGGGGYLAGHVGLTYVFLTFTLHGAVSFAHEEPGLERGLPHPGATGSSPRIQNRQAASRSAQPRRLADGWLPAACRQSSIRGRGGKAQPDPRRRIGGAALPPDAWHRSCRGYSRGLSALRLNRGGGAPSIKAIGSPIESGRAAFLDVKARPVFVPDLPGHGQVGPFRRRRCAGCHRLR
jgi:hypothetical protein